MGKERKFNFLGGGKSAPKNKDWHESPQAEATTTESRRGAFSKVIPNKSGNSERHSFLSQRNQAPSNEEVQEASETEAVKVIKGILPLEGIYKTMEMGVFQKGGMSEKNSDKYNAVVTSLENVLNTWNTPTLGDMENVYNGIKAASIANGKLRTACANYLRHRPLSSKGKARWEIVNEISRQVNEDDRSLKTYLGQHFSLPEGERAKSVKDALTISRRKILVMEKADSEYEHVGGQASRLTVFEEGDLKDSNASGFFKEEEFYTHHDKGKHRAVVLESMERVRKIVPISDKLYNKACNYIIENYEREYLDKKSSYSANVIAGGLKKMSGVPASEKKQFHEFIELVISTCNTWITVISDVVNTKGLANMELKDGERVNLTNRNVASSRMAEALGVGNLIAKSETVEMREPGQKKGRIGNLMQKAKGRAAEKVGNEYQDKAIAQHEKDGTAITDSNLMAQKMTGNFQKQMASLQVLDYLMGQVDRHQNNYFIQENDKGELDSITGIDNDLSFGNVQVGDNWKYGSFELGKNGRSPVDMEGNFILPHMDKAFAERILAFTDEQLTFLLGDLIEEKNIKHACKRLHTLQKAIREKMEEDREKEGSEKTFLTDEQWNEKTLEDSRTMGNGHGTYLGELLGTQKAAGIEIRKKLRKNNK